MNFALLSTDGFLFILRWLHFFFGVIWIGHLYYFNFVQGAFFAETDAATKSGAIQKLVPRALWWFRHGAMYTLVSGALYLGLKAHLTGTPLIFASSWGITILTGAAMGIVMWANVWFVIWPNQQIVIANATAVAKGGAANPAAAGAGAKAGLASRHNVLMSIPLLFFMGAASHLPIVVGENAHLGVLALVIGLIILGIEFNALKGKTGVITTVKGVITSGFVLTLIMYVVIEVLTK